MLISRARGLVALTSVALSFVQPHLGFAPLLAQDDGRLVRGTVTDTAGRPIPFANVMLVSQQKIAADTAGRFGYRAPLKGSIGLRFYRIGYEPRMVQIDPSGDTTITVALTPIPRTLEAVQITADRISKRLQAFGFYERMNDRQKGIGSGSFFTIDDIEARRPQRISHMVQDVPGVRVIQTRVSGDGIVMGSNRCPYTVYLDGTRISPRMDGKADVANASVDPLVPPSAAAAIEVYPRGVGASGRFPRAGGTCGVLVVWTR